MRATRSSLALLVCSPLFAATPASAQKKGGTLRLYHNDNPPSTSLLEESTIASVMPFAAVFNNLVVFDPAKPHESIDTVIPDLAESWSWDSTNTKLTFKLKQGVKWHDGQPFTAKDVQCTWRMLIGKGDTQDFKRNPRKVWYTKLQDISINGDDEATFELSEPQPSLPVLLASAFSPVYPCHVPQQVMRTKPVGTGPFKFVEFKRGDSIRLVRNPDYFKKDRPYLDEISVRTIDSRATRMLAFSTGDFDITFPSDVNVPLLKDIKARAPHAVCEMITTGTLINLMVNRANPPFDNPEIRKAMSLALDRKPFNAILMEGQGRMGGAMLPQPEGEWGMPPDMVNALTGYGPDSREELEGSAGDHGEARLQRGKAAADQDPDAQSADLSRSRGDRLGPVEEDFHRRRAGYSGYAALVLKTARARNTPSGSISPASASTTPTAISWRTIPATRSAITRNTATPRSTSCWPRNRASSTGTSARRSSGISSAFWSRTPQGRWSCMGRRAIAGSPMCGITSRTTTASTTPPASRMCGWTSELP